MKTFSDTDASSRADASSSAEAFPRSKAFDRGRAFVLSEGRLLEQRLYAVLFEDADPAGAVDALRGYRNPDGGLGHGLEPDKLCPHSLPIDVEFALHTLVTAETTDTNLVGGACDWLQSVATPEGAVPLCLPVVEDHPRAEHIAPWTYEPGLNPTAGLTGLLHRLGAQHPWLDRATDWCWDALDAGFPEDAHGMLGVLTFLAHVPDRDRAAPLAARAAAWLPRLRHYRADAADPEYGVTPLHLAPTPDSPWRGLFTDAAITAHLARLRRDQQPDGGWPLTWQPPSTAATLAYRASETLRALQVLAAYER